MFVTSAATGSDDEPLAGSLFEVSAGVQGAPTYAYGGCSAGERLFAECRDVRAIARRLGRRERLRAPLV